MYKRQALNKANTINVTEGPAPFNSKGKNWPTKRFASHKLIVEMATASPLTWVGKISEITTHVTGPNEKAKQAINRITGINTIHPADISVANITAASNNDNTAPPIPHNSNGFLPALSIK